MQHILKIRKDLWRSPSPTPLHKGGPAIAGNSGYCSAKFLISSQMKTSQPLWATCSVPNHPHKKKKHYIHIIIYYGSSTCPVPVGVQETAESHPDHKWNIQPQKGESFAYLHRKDGYHLSLVGHHILKMRGIRAILVRKIL